MNMDKWRMMHAIADISKIIITEKNIEAILVKILETCINNISSVIGGKIYQYNGKEGILELKAYKGILDNTVRYIELKSDYFMDGLGQDMDVKLILSDSKEKNTKASISNEEITIPMVLDYKIVGVMVINIKYIVMDDYVLDFINSMVNFASIAISNTMTDSLQDSGSHSLDRYSKKMHTMFTDMIIKGSSIKDLIVELKHMIGYEVFLLDLLRFVSYNTYDSKVEELIKDLPDLVLYLKEYNTMFFNTDDKYYHIYPVKFNDEIISWLCIAADKKDLTESEEITISSCNTTIAIELEKKRELRDLELSMKGDFIDSLLLNNDSGYIKKWCKQYCYEIDKDYRVVIMEFNINELIGKKDGRMSYGLIQNYYDIVNKQSTPHCIPIIKDNKIVIIFDIDTYNIDEFADRFKDSYYKLYTYQRCNYAIGVSDTYKGIDKFYKTYANAEYALKVAKQENKKNSMIYYNSIEIKRFLLNTPKEELKAFISSTLGPLMDSNKRNNKEFLITLKTYLQNNSNWSLTKDMLHIHGNTLTYRLKRISEILNLDFDNYNDKLRMQIAFEIIDILEKDIN